MIPVDADVDDITALLFALLCGFCYGMFLILAKRLAIPAGISYTGMLVGFGALYLVPMTSTSVISIFSPDMLIYLLPLAIIPTIFGYYFTTKALTYTSASTVQIFEVTEPIFSAILAFLVLG